MAVRVKMDKSAARQQKQGVNKIMARETEGTESCLDFCSPLIKP